MIYSYLSQIYPKSFLKHVNSFNTNLNLFTNKNVVIKNSKTNLYIKHTILNNFLYFLSKHMNTSLTLFVDLSASDYPNSIYRYLCVYNLSSFFYNMRVTLKVPLKKNYIHSITHLYHCASWFERECWDLFGIFFLNNIDLRRLLCDYGFSGHPLKKDFPLSGFFEIYFSLSSNLVDYKYIKMIQEFRFFNNQSPWKYYI